METMEERAIDVIEIKKGSGNYVLISENRLNFISGISDDSLPQVLKDEDALIESEEVEKTPELGPSISFIPTLNCNLRCIYCYARGGEDKVDLNPYQAKKAIDNLVRMRKNYQDETLAIYFVGGGEPFLNFKCMSEVYDYAKSKFAEVDVILVSNGTFGKKEREWIIKNSVTARISFDGLFHNVQRPFRTGSQSNATVEKNIRALVEAEVPLTVQLTVTAQGVDRMADSVEYVSGLGVKYIKVEPVHHSAISRGEKNLVPEVEKYVEAFIETIKLILKKNLEVKIDNSIISRPTRGYYCGAGEGSNMIITPFGDITSCLEISRQKSPYSDIMIFGQSKDGGFEIDGAKREFLNRLHISSYQKCQNCEYGLICGGGCPMQGAWDHGDLLTPSDYNCRMHKLLLPRLFEMIFDENRILDVLFDNHSVEIRC